MGKEPEADVEIKPSHITQPDKPPIIYIWIDRKDGKLFLKNDAIIYINNQRMTLS